MFKFLLVCIFTKATLATLDPTQLPVEVKKLYTPPLEEIAQVLNKGLKEHYSEVEVDVVDSPDLKEPPFTLANSGLNGNTKLISVGGVDNSFPTANRSKVYDIRHILQTLNLNSAFLIGTHNGPHDYTGINCEGVGNINFMNDKITQLSRVIILKDDGSYVIKFVPEQESRFDIQGDYFMSDGKPGPVLKVHVRRRISEESFGVSILKTLIEHYGDNVIGLGGTFVMKEGKALHILTPDFSKTPMHTLDDVNKWLHWYNMTAPLTSVGIITTGRYGLDLHRHHFHSFSYHDDGGHYVTDTTPETVEYLGYFNVADYVVRIDRPPLKNRLPLTTTVNTKLF